MCFLPYKSFRSSLASMPFAISTIASGVFTSSLAVHAFHQSQVFLFKISTVSGCRCPVLQGLVTSPKRHEDLWCIVASISAEGRVFQTIFKTAIYHKKTKSANPTRVTTALFVCTDYAQIPYVSPFPALASLPGSCSVGPAV